MSERTCSKCGVSKPEAVEFFRRRGTKDRGGLRPDCRECNKARDRAYYEANPDYFRAYRKANAERIAAYQAAYMPRYYRTPAGNAAMRRAVKKFVSTEAGRRSQALAQQRRRARVAGLVATFTAADWAVCLDVFDHRCAYCGTVGGLHQEHVVPVELGGAFIPGNIVPACRPCNSSKNTRALADWFPRQSFYSEERMMSIVGYLGMVA